MKITIAQAKYKTEECDLDYEIDTEQEVKITLRSATVGNLTSKGYDFFEAFCKLRKRIEPEGWLLVCAGAKKNAYPSRMSRDMSNGRSLYILELGQSATMDNVVDIFDKASFDEVGTVSEQENWYKKWLHSLR